MVIVYRILVSNWNAEQMHRAAETASKYTVNWTKGSDNTYWEYEIIPTDKKEFEKYAPNGTPWIYKVTEVIEEPWSSYYQKTPGSVEKSALQDASIVMPDLKNSITTAATATKTWVTDTEGKLNVLTTDYLGYKMKVTFELQARIDGVGIETGFDGKNISSWQNAYDLLYGINPDSVEEFTKENSFEDSPVNYITQKPQSWCKVDFNGLYRIVVANADSTETGVQLQEEDIVRIKYRVVESKIEYYREDADGSDQLIYTQNYTVNTDGDDIEYTSEQEGIFNEVKLNGAAAIKNVLPLVSLKITKHWDDNDNAAGTRPDKIQFVIQKRPKGSGSWANVQTYAADGSAKDYVRELQIKKDQDTAELLIRDLPKYGFTENGTNTTVIEYEYRARELKPDAVIEDGKVSEADILSVPGAKYDDVYQITGITDTDAASLTAPDPGTGDPADPGQTPDPAPDYATDVTNGLIPADPPDTPPGESGDEPGDPKDPDEPHNTSDKPAVPDKAQAVGPAIPAEDQDSGSVPGTSAQTGDSAAPELYATLALIALAALIMCFVSMRRNTKEKK